MQAVLTSEAFAFIPEPIRNKLGLKPGSVLDFDETAPFLKAVPAFDIADMMACIGAGNDGFEGKILWNGWRHVVDRPNPCRRHERN